MPHIPKKKPRILKKKASLQTPHCHNGQPAPAKVKSYTAKVQKSIHLGVSSVNDSQQSPKTEFVRYKINRVIYLSTNSSTLSLQNKKTIMVTT
jgi:hypothetical protein